MSSEDSEWASGMFRSSADGGNEISDVDDLPLGLGQAERGLSSVFSRELTAPRSLIVSDEIDEVDETPLRGPKASDQRLHGRLLGWLSAVEAQVSAAKIHVFSGGYNAPLTLYVKDGAFVSGALLRGRPFFDLEFKREVPELFTMGEDELDVWWRIPRAKGPAQRMLMRLLVRGASLSTSRNELRFEPCSEDEIEGPGGTLLPLELLLEEPKEDALDDLAFHLHGTCANTAIMGWMWRRTSEGIGTLGAYSAGATIQAATFALDAARSLVASSLKKGSHGLSLIRFDDASWTICWTDDWLSLQLHRNFDVGRVMSTYQRIQ